MEIKIGGTYNYKYTMNSELTIKVNSDDLYEVYSMYGELMYTATSYVSLGKFLIDLSNDIYA